MNFANSANPVIARILMDLGLLKENIGGLIMTATIVDDLVNWTLFAVILGHIAPNSQRAASLPLSIALVLAFVAIILTAGHLLGPHLLRWIRSRVAWPTGFIAVTCLAILFAASVAEWLGVNAFLGAFLVGAALGNDGDEKDEARDAINHFALSFFAPIYFVSMGLNANFITRFDLALVAVILIVACASKIGAVLLAAWLAGMPLNREALAIGFGLNARGATGIILAGVGLEHHLIDERLFVAIVVMALVTSLLSSVAIKRLMFPTRADAQEAADLQPS
jgi:Kef-type K+ transport system membrane component KefB